MPRLVNIFCDEKARIGTILVTALRMRMEAPPYVAQQILRMQAYVERVTAWNAICFHPRNNSKWKNADNPTEHGQICQSNHSDPNDPIEANVKLI